MSIAHKIDFETYYFIHLVEDIKTEGGKKFTGEEFNNLEQFASFLLKGEDPLRNIEELAQLPQTSDISIFFSDLVENIKQISPEEAIANVAYYSESFLDLFSELSKEPSWQENVTDRLVSGRQDLPGTYSFSEFVYSEIKNSVMSEVEKVNQESLELTNSFFSSISAAEQWKDYSRAFRNEGSLEGLFSLLDELLFFPKEAEKSEGYLLEEYMNDFVNKKNELAKLFADFAAGNPEMFRALCTGAPLVEQVEDLEEMAEAARQLEEREATPQITEEDRNLRFLLRDYIIHEIESVNSEIQSAIAQLNEMPSSAEKQNAIVDNLKILKDLGQIHKYHGIQVVSDEVIGKVQEHLVKGRIWSAASAEAVEQLCRSFVKYIDAVLEEKEEEGLGDIQNSKEILFSSWEKMEAEPVSTEMPAENQFTFTADETIGSAFREVNQKVFHRLRHLLNENISASERGEVSRSFLQSLTSMNFWYHLIGLSKIEQFTNSLMEWISDADSFEKLLENKEVLDHTLLQFETSLFETTEEEFDELRNKLIRQIRPEEAIDVTQSAEAFRDVTLRQIGQLLDKLQDRGISTDSLFEIDLNAIVTNISANSQFVKDDDWTSFCENLIDRSKQVSGLSEADKEVVREKVTDIFLAIKDSLSAAPGEIQLAKFSADLDEIFEKLAKVAEEIPEEMGDFAAETEEFVAEAEETSIESETISGESGEGEIAEEVVSEEQKTTGPTRESFVDEELESVFKGEANKYLSDMAACLDKLETDLEDRQTLKQLGDITHTLKGSAQMLSQEAIAEIAKPLEGLVDSIFEGNVGVDSRLIPLYREGVDVLQHRLNDEEVDSQSVLNSIEDYIKEFSVEETVEEVPEALTEEAEVSQVIEQVVEEEISEEIAPPEEVLAGRKETQEEKDLISLGEKDQELLEIFQSEAKTNLEIIEKEITLIEKFTPDKKAIHSLDQAVHEVRAAAKMLGFTEIGNLMDQMELVVENLKQSDKKDWSEIIPVFRRGIQVVRDLSENKDVSQQMYDGTIHSFNSFAEEFETKEKARVAEKPVKKVSEEVKPLTAPEQVMNAFLQESRENLDDINFLLMKLEKDSENEELIHHLMRSLHTIKGSAAMVYQDHVESLAHSCEDIIEGFTSKTETIPQDAFDLMFEAVDEMQFIVDTLASGYKGKTKNYEDIIKRLRAYRTVELEVVEGTEEKLEEEHPELKEKPAVVIEEPAEEKEEYLTITEELEAPAPQKDTYIRLHVKKMDELLNEAAELVINNTQFKMQIDKLKNYIPRFEVESKNLQNILWYLDTIIHEEQRIIEMTHPFIQNNPSIEESQKNQLENIRRALHNLKIFFTNISQTAQGIKESGSLYEEQAHKISSLSTHMHEEIMQARLVPIAILFQRFHRPLRDLAHKTHKKIKLYIEGENTELDRVLIEELYEPMLHILRNAVDHGIELPADRVKNGKEENGLIQIKAKQERNFVTVEVADDGQGIDAEKVRQKAVELDLIEDQASRDLSESEIFEYLMYPGFSTVETTTTISGRGVGLDVVRNNVQKIKGDMRISSQKGKGTSIVIRVPISLTVTQAMLVEVAGNVYAIPLLQVEETINVSIRNLELKNGLYYTRHRGSLIPIIYMANLLKTRGAQRKAVSLIGEYPAIIIQDEGIKVALLMDRIVHREEILIKSLGRSLQKVQYISGGSVLADGKVVLVLDVPQIIKEASRTKENVAALSVDDIQDKEPKTPDAIIMESGNRKIKKIIEGRNPLVLVVDDSLSIRKFLANLLKQQGFKVEMAKNGYEALEKLNQNSFDLVITDLEMPHLSGYELIEQVRNDSRWDYLPIIVLTGRASKHIQQLTMNLGADEFIIKPFKENALIEKIGEFIQL